MLADVYWDHHTAEKVALVCPLAKCHLLLSFDELSVLTKIASLRISGIIRPAILFDDDACIDAQRHV